MPPSLELTVPVPLPVVVTVRGVAMPNAAVTARLVSITIVHTLVALAQPIHASNTEPVPGAAVSVTAVPVA